jgi:hypothetical protein
VTADAYVRGYRRACRHLLAAGLLPAPCMPELQELWSGSREDRVLVQQITSRWEITL